ncbi:MAG: hypothetical protein M3347_18940, partial [Armatimonadota bacterium]|nr:hypothetical protein [Armatimonadota bacterium]
MTVERAARGRPNSNNYAGTNSAGQIRGIVTSSGTNTITGNTVRNLATASLNQNITSSASVLGIVQGSSGAGQTLSQNVVHSLSNTAAGLQPIAVIGMYFTSATSGTNLVARNLVHSLAVTASTSDSSSTTGIELGSGTMIVQNNMVRLGIDASGASTSGVSILRGLYDNASSPTRNFYHNSVYLGGTQTGGSAQTFAAQSTGTTNARTFRNNIFVNARTRTGGTNNKHYAVRQDTATGLTSDNNIFFVNGVGGNVGFFNSDRATMADWRSATGKDSLSQSVAPQFIAPTAATPDVHLQASNPAGATASGNPPIQNINGKPATINSYTISAAIGGTKTVCASGCDFTSLTGNAPGGAFAVINSSALEGNLTLNISGDLSEDGTHGLNQVVSTDFPSYTVTIQPADGTLKTISGNVANGMIRLNGADGVTIDGRSGGTGRFLRFRNTNTSNPTIALLNDASNNTIRSSIIEGATTSTTNGVVFVSTGTTTGNDNNTITDNLIRDRSDATGVPANLIFSQGTSSAVANTGNTLSQNEVVNFTVNGISLVSNNESWTIQGNTIHQTAARTTALVGIGFRSLGTNTIAGNTLHDLNTSQSLSAISLGSTGGIITVTANR